MKLMQFEGLVLNLDNVTHIEVGPVISGSKPEKWSTVIHFVSGGVKVINTSYKEVCKRLYKLNTGAYVNN